jgi:hypothetical protein
MGFLLKRLARDHELCGIEALFRFQRNGVARRGLVHAQFADSASSLAIRAPGSPETSTCLSRLFEPATIRAFEVGAPSRSAKSAHKA